MKKLALAVSLLAGATAGYSQGVLNWSDNVPNSFIITVWSGGTETPGTGSAPNNTSIDLPAGNATYTGTPAAGTAFEIGLYVDTSSAAVANDVATGSPVPNGAQSTGSTTFGINGNAGTWDLTGSLDATIPGLISGTAVYVDLAAWDTSQGATSYAQAVSQNVAVGTSGPSTTTTSLGGAGSPPATPGNLAGIGLQDFIVTTSTPEPSTIALGVMGASAFLMRLRRK